MTTNERRLIDELLTENRLKAAHFDALAAMLSGHPVDHDRLPDPELELVLDTARYSRRCELYRLEVCREEAMRALANPS